MGRLCKRGGSIGRLCIKRKIGKLKSWVQRGTMGYMRGRLLKNEEDCEKIGEDC